MPTNEVLLASILKRLSKIETQLVEVLPLMRAAVASAEKSADAATAAVLAFESLSARFELLRQEHVANHPGTSHVPAALHTKTSAE